MGLAHFQDSDYGLDQEHVEDQEDVDQTTGRWLARSDALAKSGLGRLVRQVFKAMKVCVFVCVHC